jgi:hypothetical protein
VQDAEQALEAARTSHRDQTAELWSRYQPGYERSLRTPTPDQPSAKKWWHEAADEQRDDVPTAATASRDDVRTPVDGDADGVEEKDAGDSVAAGSDVGRLDGVSS